MVRRFDHGEISRLATITNTLSANDAEFFRTPVRHRSKPSCSNTACTAATAPNPGAPSAASSRVGSQVSAAWACSAAMIRSNWPDSRSR